MNTSHYEIIEKAFSNVLPFVQYSTPITEINYFGDKPYDDDEDDDDEEDEEAKDQKDYKKVVIFDKSGKRYEGDYVIVTVPIS